MIQVTASRKPPSSPKERRARRREVTDIKRLGIDSRPRSISADEDEQEEASLLKLVKKNGGDAFCGRVRERPRRVETNELLWVDGGGGGHTHHAASHRTDADSEHNARKRRRLYIRHARASNDPRLRQDVDLTMSLHPDLAHAVTHGQSNLAETW